MKNTHFALLSLGPIVLIITGLSIVLPKPHTRTSEEIARSDYSGFFCMTNGKAWSTGIGYRGQGYVLWRDFDHDKDCKK